jgi:predicted Zn-dependent protease
VEAVSTTVQISPGVLRPGANYYCRVRTVDPEKPSARGEAVFSTLSEDKARRRAALKAHVKDTKDPSLLALMAELDRSLGLRWEACEELRAALDHSPGNRPLEQAVVRFECIESKGSAEQRK